MAECLNLVANGLQAYIVADMRLVVRFALPLLCVLGIMAGVLTPVADSFIARWFQHDVEMRSRLIFTSAGNSLTRLIHDASQQEIERLFDRIAEDERVLAVGWCSPNGQLQETSKAWPRTLGCPEGPTNGEPAFRMETLGRGTVLSATFPLSAETGGQGHLVILNDMSFAAIRSVTARFYLMGFLALLGVAAAGVTVLMAQLTLRHSVGAPSLQGAPATHSQRRDDPQIAPVIGEIRQLIRDLNFSHQTSGGIRVDWSPNTLAPSAGQRVARRGNPGGLQPRALYP